MIEGFVRKRCPKCGGNVYLDRDNYGWYDKCLQCAYTSDLNIIEVPKNISGTSLGQTGGRAQAKK